MNAREYFENAREAQRTIDRRLAVLESLKAREGVRAQRYDVIVDSSTASTDAMRIIDQRIDEENKMRKELSDLMHEVDKAREVCAGIRKANPRNRVWGDVLELRYLEDIGIGQIAKTLSSSKRHVYTEISCALDWLDSVGIANAIQGRGNATD